MRRHLRHVCLLRPIVMLGVAVLNLIHPLLHHMEAGSLDAVLTHLDVWAMNFALTPVED